jgi:hypothetical protein
VSLPESKSLDEDDVQLEGIVSILGQKCKLKETTSLNRNTIKESGSLNRSIIKDAASNNRSKYGECILGK